MSWELKEGVAECPAGFQAAAVEAGIKYKNRLDLTLIQAKPSAVGAAMFTTNRVKAAPIVLCAENLTKSGGKVGAILVNSGCANAATGSQGMEASQQAASAVAELLKIAPNEVMVASTGVIGVQLPVDKITNALPKLTSKLSSSGFGDFAQAILTTDTKTKKATVAMQVGDKKVTICGVAKGSGMIHPNMATMLVFILTDAVARPKALKQSLKVAADQSFHRISVDGDTSTNDAVFLLASCASAVEVAEDVFQKALNAVCKSLALQIVKDGEGAKKLMTTTVIGGANDGEAEQVAKTIASSLLVRTAVAGGDPNWGRILAATGRAGVAIDSDVVTIAVENVPLFERGKPSKPSPDAVKKAFAGPEVTIRVDLGRGSGSATFWTCDLTDEYVHINADYTT